ncbi:response regulator transcription factor [Campylobacter pinnipediorum]|uniref:DNA-binding response regulator n=1 Tax=Campylobacter pinnipediorum subsp. pinnipediorum TaxID=1660067 RepID=A0AAX0L8S7_9BACT|nr:response regulator transcription factor [Campylobacter pinnipediorum]AQW80563.1 two-component system response regulator [Campylobacter pinnipediorum subsp. pinnipediorum]AQW82232.1 two-component system response regulator [Campylobacter pinnipediorum subsp. pinnipediorum]AQW83909.1 two-component system response regulator [Campylobacter pinnipediorum subsp. pinnipediorum]OPA74930.1 DNA-binding response regulator [Campylobacter pinnipediorum subsp. pinnipediorum]OPA75042.1 DNA-binding response
MVNVLMIEDDPEFSQILSEYLENFNIKVTSFEDPYLGLSAGVKNYDLLILDLTLPGIDGLEVCKEIRQKYDIPIIISSARSDISDKVIGLSLGADDYLPKPYDPKEMYARIMSLIRRYKKSHEVTEEAIDSVFRIDEKRHEVYFNNEPLVLTPAEYEILTYLIKQHSFSVSREQLVYNCKSLKDKDSKSLDVIIGRLRTKIGDSSKSPKHIFSVRGIGYKLIG